MQALAKDIAYILQDAGISVCLNNPQWKLSEVITDSNKQKPDLHVALHSNAGGGTGTETWCWKTQNTESAKFSLKLQAALVKALGLPDRGIKDGTAPGHVLAEIGRIQAVSVLTEIFFHDNIGDVQRFKERRQAVVDAVARTICEWFRVTAEKPQETLGTRFIDVAPGRWSHDAILKVVDEGLMTGYPDGAFLPARPVTREELASVVARLLQKLGGAT